MDLPGSVAPFILRGVTLAGVDSVMAPLPLRIEAWNRLATDLPLDLLDALVEVHPLADAPRLGAEILDGKVRGRVVLSVRSEEHTSELQSLMRISYAVFCLKKKTNT